MSVPVRIRSIRNSRIDRIRTRQLLRGTIALAVLTGLINRLQLLWLHMG